MVYMSDFDSFTSKPPHIDFGPKCQAPACFVGSYAPVSKPGIQGDFYNNSYLLQPTRKFETVGAVPVRSGDVRYDCGKA